LPDVGRRRDKWRRYGAATVALGLGAVLAVEGCQPSHGPAAQTPAASGRPPWLAQPLQPAAPSATASSTVRPLPATVANPNAPHFDPASIVPLLRQPALAEIAAAYDREAYKGAADKLEALLRGAKPRSVDEARLAYQLGRLREKAGDPAGAVRAFDRAAAVDWALADYARFHAATNLVAMDLSAEALTRLAPVRPGLAIDQALALTRARALASERRVDEAAPLWDRYLAADPKPRGFHLPALRYARALLSQPSVAHAEKAVEVARMVIYHSHRGRGVGEARELEKQALATLPSTKRSPLQQPPHGELAKRARALAEAQQGREARAAADTLIGKLRKSGADKPSEEACEAHLAKGKGLGTIKRYSEASEAMAVAIKRCAGNPRQVVALFLGGRYAWRGGRIALARKRYAMLEKNFPDHRFADDARLHGAETALELGDVAAFTRLLSTVDRDYPNGDMVDQGLFTLARHRIDAGDWAGALRPLERAVKRQYRGRPYYAEGRPQYFLARAKLELGATEQGEALLAKVIRDFPLSYYMVLAYGRLAQRNPAAAERAVAQAMGAEPEGDFVIPDHPELHRSEFLRAVELVKQGDAARALDELDSLGVRDRSAEPAVLWASAFLLARIDAPAQSHWVLRGSKQLYREHYPAGIWRSLWEVAYPRPYHDVVRKETQRFGVAEPLAYAIMREESAFNPRAVSPANAYGLMQLIVPTARSMARKIGLTANAATLKQPAVNVALGCRFLSVLMRRFPDAPQLAIPGYNAGGGAPARWVKRRPDADFDLFVEAIPYKETRRYTKRVIGTMAAYAALYGGGMKTALLSVPEKVSGSGSTARASTP
jgi:soluble lytic murein transglycosylase